MSHVDPDPRTPIVVGVGQASERLGEPGYRALSAVELGAAAAEQALIDAGARDDRLASAIDTVAGVRQFEIASPTATAPLGRSNNYPRSVAGRIGAQPRRAVLDVTGGQSPQQLVNEFASAIAAGEADVVLLVGSEAISTVRHFADRDDRPDFSETVDGDLEDRGHRFEELVSEYELHHGLIGAAPTYALCENARRARLGLSRTDYARTMGELFAPFTRVAAANPHAAAPVERDAGELVAPSERNRMIADPYPRYVVARDQVNQGAAVVLTSVAAARELGIPRYRWVFLHGHADLRERALLDREDLSRAPASVAAARHALELARVGRDEIAAFDVYSCFPIAVFATAIDGLGLSPNDPRGLTATGGLPFFGGPGNDYSMHAIAEIVGRVRRDPGTFGFVGANGGLLSTYSVGIYGTRPAPWTANRSAELQAELDARPAPGWARRAAGWATIETYTVVHDREGGRTGIVVGRHEDDGRRILAMTSTDDPDVLELLSTGEPIGQRVFAWADGTTNRVGSVQPTTHV